MDTLSIVQLAHSILLTLQFTQQQRVIVRQLGYTLKGISFNLMRVMLERDYYRTAEFRPDNGLQLATTHYLKTTSSNIPNTKFIDHGLNESKPFLMRFTNASTGYIHCIFVRIFCISKLITGGLA